jgi:site-specific recombinase XerD
MRLLLIPLRWGVRAGWFTFDPTVGFKSKKPRPKLNPVPTVEVIEALLEAPRQAKRRSIALRDLAILRLLYSTGLRSGELCRLDLADAQMGEKLLRVAPGKGEERWLPLTESVATALQAYLEKSRPRLANPQETALFVGLAGPRLSPSALGSLVAVYAKTAGLGTLSPHDLRRACATHLLEAGVPLVVIKSILGHKDLSSTQIYAQVRPQELIREYRRTHPRFR